MRIRRIAGRVLGGAIVMAAGLAAAPANGPFAALNLIQPGEWQFKEAGAGNVPISVCVADPQLLLQLQHRGARCSRFIVDDEPRTTTIHYTCPSAGHGRTSIAIETPVLIHLQTQGIAGGAPFDFDYEGRRTGACSAPAPR